MTTTTVAIAHRALAGHHATKPPGQLLERYAATRDPEAFAGLVLLFGPFVLGTCRRVLGPDADDTFQAVFLALARHAGGFRDAAALPAWLHRVSLRLARKALAGRRSVEALTEAVADPGDPFADVAWRDVRRVLDEEIDALAEQYRGPVVLCWLDGLTQDEAAARLGLSRTTLKRRLDAGRELLRGRLARRGLAPVLAAVAALPAGNLRANVPAALAAGLLRAAVAVKPAAGVPRLVGLVLLAVAGGLAVALAGHAPPSLAPEPRAVPHAKPADAPPAEPLPKGAVARFGGTQFRAPGELYSSALSPDGTLLAVGGTFGVRLHEPGTWRLVHALPANAGDGVWTSGDHLAFSPDGHLLGFTKNGRFAFLWDVKTGKELHRFDSGDDWAWGACGFTPGGLFVISDNKSLRFINPASGREVRSVGITRRVAAISPDGAHFITQSTSGGPFPRSLHDTATGQERHAFDERAGSWGGVAFSPDGKRLTLATADGTELQIWDVAAPKLLKRLKAPPAERKPGRPGFGSGFTADGREVWLEMPTGDLVRWDAATFAERPRLACGTGLPMSGLVPADRTTLLATTQFGWVRIFDAATGAERLVPGRYRHPATLAPAPGGTFVAVGDHSGRIDLLDAGTGALVRSVREKGDPVRWLTFGPGGAVLAVGEGQGVNNFDRRGARVRAIRVSDGQELWSRDREAKAEWSLVPLGFASGGSHLILDHAPRGVRVCDTATGKERCHIPSANSNATPSPDGTRLATDAKGEVVLFDLATGREVKRIAVAPLEKGPGQEVGAARFGWSGDGKVLATTVSGDHVCVLDPATGRERKRFPVSAGEFAERFKLQLKRIGGRDTIVALALSPDGKRLAAAALNGFYVAVWDTETGNQLAKLDHDFQVESVAFTPDGKDVITFGLTGLGYRWDVDRASARQKK